MTADGQSSSGAARAIGRSTLALVAITAAVKVVGFVEKQVIAYFFGADSRVDAFFVALAVPTTIFLLVRELVEPAFLPLFVRRLDEGRADRAGQLFTAVAIGIGVLSFAAAGAAWLAAESLAAWLAPGLTPEARALTSQLVRVMVAGAVALALSTLTYITLNGQRRFALPASGDLVQKAAPVLLALLLARELGILALAIGVLVGSVGRLFVHLAGLARERRWLAWPATDGHDDRRRLLLLMAPLALGAAFAQVSELADNYFSSQVESGAIAGRTYARRIVDLPVLLLPYALSVVAFPHFAGLVARADLDGLFAFAGRTLRGLALAFAYLCVVTFLLAEPLVTLLLERGAFDAQARTLTAWPLRMYALGLVTFAVEALLVPLYFALGDTRTPVLVGILGVCVNVALAALLLEPLGVGGVALALTLSKTLKVVVLGGLLRRKRSGLRLLPATATALRLLVAMGAGGMGIAVATRALPAPGAAGSLSAQLAHLTLASSVALALFLGTIASMRSPERELVAQAGNALLRVLRLRRGSET